MFRSVLIGAILMARLISCSGRPSEEGVTGKSSNEKGLQYISLQRLFRFSKGSLMFSDPNGIPYQYHIPRVDLVLEDLNNGRVKIPNVEYSSRRRPTSVADADKQIETNGSVGKKVVHSNDKFGWRLAATTRKLTAPEENREHLWRRDPVPLNRLMVALESPIFLGNFFYALTSLTMAGGTTVRSRFYYAPVLTAKYGNKKDAFSDLTLSDMELNVFSVCIEPSDAPEDVSVPLMHRPQRIIDAGLRKSSHNKVYDVKEKLQENATEGLAKAKNYFANENWDSFLKDPIRMAFRQPLKQNSRYEIIKTPFGDRAEDKTFGWSSCQTQFHGYDPHNKAYICAYGPGGWDRFIYCAGDIDLLIFLNPKAHFKDESKLWDMCVDLWREEMRARYETDTNSHLVHPRTYLNKSASIAPYYKMLPRHEALKNEYGRRPRRSATQPNSASKPRMQRRRDNSGGITIKDMLEASKLQEALNRAETVMSPEESVDSRPPCKRYRPASAKPGPSDLPNNGSNAYSSEHWTDGLLRPVGPSSTEARENGPACANPPTTGLPFGLVPQPALPRQFDDEALAAIIQQQVEPMDFTEALSLLYLGDLTIWSNLAFLTLLDNPIIFSCLYGCLTILNNQTSE